MPEYLPPTERGRYYDIARENRMCTLCNSQEIGDQFHYIFKCNFFANKRRKYIRRNLSIYPNILNFQTLMCSTDRDTLLNLALFVKIVTLKL